MAGQIIYQSNLLTNVKDLVIISGSFRMNGAAQPTPVWGFNFNASHTAGTNGTTVRWPLASPVSFEWSWEPATPGVGMDGTQIRCFQNYSTVSGSMVFWIGVATGLNSFAQTADPIGWIRLAGYFTQAPRGPGAS